MRSRVCPGIYQQQYREVISDTIGWLLLERAKEDEKSSSFARLLNNVSFYNF